MLLGGHEAAQLALAASNMADIGLVVDCRSEEAAPGLSGPSLSRARWCRLDINRMLRGKIGMQEAVDQFTEVFAALGRGEKVLLHCNGGRHRSLSQYGACLRGCLAHVIL